MTLAKSDKMISVLLIFLKWGSVGGICLHLIWAWKAYSKLVTVLPIVWVELFGSSRENDFTPTDEQEPKQPNSRNRLRCRLDWLPLEQKNYKEPDRRQATRGFLILLAVFLPSRILIELK